MAKPNDIITHYVNVEVDIPLPLYARLLKKINSKLPSLHRIEFDDTSTCAAILEDELNERFFRNSLVPTLSRAYEMFYNWVELTFRFSWDPCLKEDKNFPKPLRDWIRKVNIANDRHFWKDYYKHSLSFPEEERAPGMLQAELDFFAGLEVSTPRPISDFNFATVNIMEEDFPHTSKVSTPKEEK